MGPASPPGDAVTDNRTLIDSAFSDSINNLTVRTTGSDPFDRPIVNIITGNRPTKLCLKTMSGAASMLTRTMTLTECSEYRQETSRHPRRDLLADLSLLQATERHR
jgi:hypothetical protein